MILPRFDLAEPASLGEVCRLLDRHAHRAKIMAGGTDLLVSMKKKLARPDLVVSLAKVPEFRQIRYLGKDGVAIGSMVTVAELAESESIRRDFPVLSLAASKLGSPQVRNLATLGGNICSARPAGDTLGPLIAYGGVVKLVGKAGERNVGIEKFFTGPGQTVLQSGEVLTEILLPIPPARTSGSYIKYGIRKAMEIAMVNVTCLLSFNGDEGACGGARVVLGAVGPTYIRCTEAEALLTGKKVDEALALQAGLSAGRGCSPITDIRASAAYRRTLAEVLTRRSILEALEAAEKEK